MRRAALIIIDIAAALSLLVCIAAVFFWVNGKSETHILVRESTGSYQTIAVSRGELSVFDQRGVGSVFEPWPERTHWQCHSREPEDFCATTAILVPNAHAPAAGFFFWRFSWSGNTKTWV